MYPYLISYKSVIYVKFLGNSIGSITTSISSLLKGSRNSYNFFKCYWNLLIVLLLSTHNMMYF